MRKSKVKFQFLSILFIFAILSINSFIESNINNGCNSEISKFNYEEHLLPYTSSGSLKKNYFTYCKEIIIDSSKVMGSTDLINFPFLLSIYDSDLHIEVQSNGNDIAFYNGTNWLDHEFELFKQDFNTTHARLIAWIRIPYLSTSSDTKIYMYYGNSTMGSQQNPEGVWDSNYYAVYHMNQDPSVSSVLDSTANNYDLNSGPGFTSGDSVNGIINKAIKFNGQSDEYLNISSGFSNPTNCLSLEMWFKPQQLDAFQRYFTAISGYYPEDICFKQTGDDNMLRTRIKNSDGDESVVEGDFYEWDLNQFYHFVMTWEGGSVGRHIQYLNGALNGNETDIDGFGTASPWSGFFIGTDLDFSDPSNVIIEEFRITSNVRSSGWFETEYNNQKNPNTFYSLSSQYNADITPPTYSNLIENADPLELGQTEVIKINVSDYFGINQVKIEFEGANQSMTNIGGDTWQYDAWTPSMVDNYTYIIYMQDNMNNWNSTVGTIEVLDRTPPTYSNFIESSDPLELGEIEVIKIDVSDLSDIFEVKIEIEGLNHSMTNNGGNTWQYSWEPNNWIVYQYKIHMRDNYDNWNTIINTITVQDTLNPPPPTLTNPPSGYISGNVVFDWLNGSDPSGIAYYILIIDNETDLSITPGYVYKVNITNTGQESSYYELTENLPPGQYWYFLAQIDGAGHQSDYTKGSFTFNLNPNNNNLMIYIIIAIIVISAVGSISAITVVRRKSYKKMDLPKKKVLLKIILGHLDKLSPPKLTSDEIKLQNVLIQKERDQYSSEDLPNESNIGTIVDEIKTLGEELFSEGAYLEAIRQFQHAKDLLLKQGRHEDTVLFSDLIEGIEGLIQEREKRFGLLENEKIGGDSVKIFELYYEIIDISKRLRDLDTASFYQSELIQFFQINKSKQIYLENYRDILEEKADSLLNNEQFETAAQIYGKCERISEVFLQSGRDGETAHIEKYKNKKAYCLESFKEKNFQV
ncbi:MAG: DUF2341 domain-containing protein [Promethearchaeota archaeon]